MVNIKYTGNLYRAHVTDAGYDLHASEVVGIQDRWTGRVIGKIDVKERTPAYDIYKFELPFTLEKGQRCCIDTGVKVFFPADFYGEIRPRSGLAVKYGIDVLAGVVDSGYRDTIKVVLVNHGELSFVINAGDRIAQLVPRQMADVWFVEKDATELEAQTERGLGGFGSTGVKSQ